MSEPHKDEKLVKEYCHRLLADPLFNSLEVLGLRDGILLEEASFRLQLIEPHHSSLQNQAATNSFDRGEWTQWLSEVTSASNSTAETRATSDKSRPLSPLQALTTARKLLIVGDQGSGKTTLLRWLTLHAARADSTDLPDLPVLISLSEYSHAGSEALPNFIARKLGMSLSFIGERLRQGQLLLLCDGLDEAGRNEQFGQERLYQRLEEFAAEYPQVLMAVTCRRAAWRRGLRGFYAAALCDLGWEDVQDFIYRWFAKTPTAGRDLSGRLLQNFGLRSMAASPLLLSLICTIFEREGRLPNRRAELYSECIMLLQPRSKATGTLRPLSINQEIEVLGQIGFYLHRHYSREITSSDLLAILASLLPTYGLEASEAQNILISLTDGQGLLRHQTANLYSFVHLSLQEFFAAEALAKGGQVLLKNLEASLFEDWWREVILLLAGIGDATALLNLIWSKSKLGNPAILLACRCLGEEPHLLDPGLGNAIMTATMQLILEAGDDYALKAQAINALASVKRKETVGYLSALMARQDIGRFLDWDLYGRVLETLVQLNDLSVLPAAFNALGRDELDDEQKLRLIDALAAVGNWEQVLARLKTILPNLKGDPQAKVLLLLTQHGDRTVVGQALQALRASEVNDTLKYRLLPSLARAWEGERGPEPLLSGKILNLIQAGPKLGLSLRLKLCDFAIGRGGAANLLEAMRTNPQNFEQELRRRVILASSRFAGPEILPQLLVLLSETDSPELKRQVVASVAVMSTSKETDLLLAYLRRTTTLVNEYSRVLVALVEELQPGKKTRSVTQRFLLVETGKLLEGVPVERKLSGVRRDGTTGLLRSNEGGPFRRILEAYRAMAGEFDRPAGQSSSESYRYIYNSSLISAIANGPR